MKQNVEGTYDVKCATKLCDNWYIKQMQTAQTLTTNISFNCREKHFEFGNFQRDDYD